ncbi:MAG: hypothetical protein R3245_13090 [Kiloniellales bacterium]|nr:hypothetical protein [Kiloniellales bacterium]
MAAVVVLALSGATAQGADDFYKDKKIRLIVSSTPGGGNDTYSRLIARHIHRFIPGNPDIIVQNMPGAGGLLAADYLYRKAKRDGTVMEQINWGVWNWQVIGDPRAKFDFTKMNAVGVAAIENSIFYCRTERYKSVADVEKSGKLATVGVSGRQSTGYVDGKLIENVREKKMFEYVFGYPGARQYSLAVRQGEVDCSSNTTGSFWDQLGDMYKEGGLTIIAQAGTLDGKREADFAEAPLLEELAKNERGQKVAKAMFMLSHYGRPYALPPGVPQDRVQIMRKAFWKTMKDSQFLAEAKKLRRPIIPTTGADLQEMWKKALNAPPEQVEIVKQIFGDQKS